MYLQYFHLKRKAILFQQLQRILPDLEIVIYQKLVFFESLLNFQSLNNNFRNQNLYKLFTLHFETIGFSNFLPNGQVSSQRLVGIQLLHLLTGQTYSTLFFFDSHFLGVLRQPFFGMGFKALL